MKEFNKYFDELAEIGKMPLTTFSENMEFANRIKKLFENIYAEGFSQGVESKLPSND